MYLGIDFGTSGCRATVISADKELLAECQQPLPEPTRQNNRIEQAASTWISALDALLHQLAQHADLSSIQRLSIDGTSGTVLLTDPYGRVLTPALMYNDSSSQVELQQIRSQCPHTEHISLSASSALARAMQLANALPANRTYKVLHQADYLCNYLADQWGYSDYHNALKTGYDVQCMNWPKWIEQLLPNDALPRVLEPGQAFARIDSRRAQQYGFDPQLQICVGSTDANAAFIATESCHAGDAVTSLGSTLVLKILSHQPVQDLQSGIYSHRLGHFWLSGGASNAGGSVLRKYFTDQQLQSYSRKMNLDQPTGLDYYPLPGVGERFPLMDPHKQPRLSPRPDSDAAFLQAILEGLTSIEQQGYDKLQALGADQPKRIQTLGGGAGNPQWQQMREQSLGIPVQPAHHSEAAYGCALLALHGLTPYQS